MSQSHTKADVSPSPPPIVTLISYCRYERPYIASVVNQALEFSEHVVISAGTHLYSGEVQELDSEWHDFIEPMIPASHIHRVAFVTYDVILSDCPSHLNHNNARRVGVERAKELIFGPFWALFLDADEVPNGKAVKKWIVQFGSHLENKVVYKLSNYWCFLHPTLISKEYEDSVVLAHSSLLSWGALSHPRERDGLYLYYAGQATVKLSRGIRGLDGLPMFLHLSWVRCKMGTGDPFENDLSLMEWVEGTRHGLKAKVARWGHCKDTDWVCAIDSCLDNILAFRQWPSHDFVHGHKLMISKNCCNFFVDFNTK